MRLAVRSDGLGRAGFTLAFRKKSGLRSSRELAARPHMIGVFRAALPMGALIALDADGLSDELPLRPLCPRMVCTACGLIGADVRRTGTRIRTDGRRDRPFAHDCSRKETGSHLLVPSSSAFDAKLAPALIFLGRS